MLKCLIGGVKYGVDVGSDFKTVKQVSGWGSGSVMVWGGISWPHKTQLIVVDGNLTARQYMDEILEPELVPFLRNNGDITLFQCTSSFCEKARYAQYEVRLSYVVLIAVVRCLFFLLEKARYAQYEVRLSSVVLIAVVRCLFFLLEKDMYAQYEVRLSSVVLIVVVRCLFFSLGERYVCTV